MEDCVLCEVRIKNVHIIYKKKCFRRVKSINKIQIKLLTLNILQGERYKSIFELPSTSCIPLNCVRFSDMCTGFRFTESDQTILVHYSHISDFATSSVHILVIMQACLLASVHTDLISQTGYVLNRKRGKRRGKIHTEDQLDEEIQLLVHKPDCKR